MSIKKVKTPKGWRWQVDVYVNGKRHRPKLPTLELARKVEKKLIADGVARKYDLPVESYVELSELIDAYLDSIEKRGRYIVRVRTVLHRFRDMIGKTTLVETIRIADLTRYAEARLSAALKPQSVNREVTYIKACLTYASMHFRELEDWQSPKFKWLKEPRDGRRRTWTEDERQRVLAALYAPLLDHENAWHARNRLDVGHMFELSLNTGVRPNELLRLTWFDVSLDKRAFVVRSKKGGRERAREIPMNARAFEILSERAKSKQNEYVFPGRKGGPRTSYRSPFMTACERAGVSYGVLSSSGAIFYDARRTAENEMLEAGHSARDVGEILGHSLRIMTRHYARSTEIGKRSAVESLKSNVRFVTTDSEKSEQSEQSEQQKKAEFSNKAGA